MEIMLHRSLYRFADCHEGPKYFKKCGLDIATKICAQFSSSSESLILMQTLSTPCKSRQQVHTILWI